MLGLVSRLSSSPWALSLAHAHSSLPLLASLLMGTASVQEADFAAARAAAAPLDYQVTLATRSGFVAYSARQQARVAAPPMAF